MTRSIPFSRDQAFLLPPDAKDWRPGDDVAHPVRAAEERVPRGAFAVRPIPGGMARHHPRPVLALPICACANGIFPSLRTEGATYRDIVLRRVAAKMHPDTPVAALGASEDLGARSGR